MGAARPHSGLTAFRKWRTRPKYVDWSNCASSASRERNWQSTRAIARGQGAATERAPCRGVEASGRWEAHPGCWPPPALLRPGGCCPESRGLAVGLAATAGASTPIGAHRPGGGSGHELRTLTKSEWLRGLHCRQAAPQAPLWRRGDKRGRRLQSAARALEPLLLGVCSAAPHFAAGSCARPVQRRQPGQDGAWEPVRPARLVRTGSRRARGAAANFGCAPLTSRARFQCSSQTLTQRRCSRTHGLRLQSPFHPHARGHRNAASFPGSPRPASRGDADWVSSVSSCASSRVSESSAPPCGERAEAVAVGESSPPEAAAAVLG